MPSLWPSLIDSSSDPATVSQPQQHDTGEDQQTACYLYWGKAFI
jgi:hypothetical protein